MNADEHNEYRIFLIICVHLRHLRIDPLEFRPGPTHERRLRGIPASPPGAGPRPSGAELHYLDEGQGEPVVMVHGNPTWSFYYRKLVEALRRSTATIVPDHIGCGLSDKPDDDRYDYTLERRVADLESLLDHLGVDRGITLVVHDWGGMIGMGFAARHPERIARLVILNTAAFHLPPRSRFPGRSGSAATRLWVPGWSAD